MLSEGKLSFLVVGLAFLTAVITYWMLREAATELLNRQLILSWSITALLVSAVGVFIAKKKPLNISGLTTTGFVLVILTRVFYDLLIVDPTSHNLWPFEVLITILIVFPSSLIGAIIINYLTKR